MNSKSKKRIIIVLVILIVIFTISSVLFLRSFINNTTYYKPFSIEISGLDSSQFKTVNCYGLTPKNRKIVLNRDDGNFSFFSNYYMHLSDVVVCCADSVFLKINAIKLSIQESPSPYYLEMDNIVYNEKLVEQSNGFQIINFKEYYHPNYSNIKVFFAIFLWPSLRVLYVAVICVLLLFFIFWFRRPALRLLNAIVQFIRNNVRKIDVKTSRIRLLFSLILCLILCLVYFNISKFTGVTLEMKESITQTVAVNFAYGHGFPKAGFVENFDIYKISQYDATGDLSYSFLNNYKGACIYHNPPIYELFIGSIYKFSGINPLLIKQIQLLMLILGISFLPILGYKLAGKFGFWSGLLSAPIVLNRCYSIADHLEPNVMIVLFLLVLMFFFQKTILEEKKYKIVIIGLMLSGIILTQLTLILLPFFVFTYLIYLLIKKPSRKAILSFLILLTTFTIPIISWSIYASQHLNNNVIKENTFLKVHNTLLNRDFKSKDLSALEGLDNYFEIKNNDTIINDGGWTGPLSVYELFLVDNVVIPSLLHDKNIFIATKADPKLLLYTHNEYCKNGNSSPDWTMHDDSYYNNDNKNYSPFVRVFLFYINHPKQFFIESLNKIYNGYRTFTFLFIVIWSYILFFLFQYITPLFQKQDRIKFVKAISSIALIVIALFVSNISYLTFYVTLIVFSVTLLFHIFTKKNHYIKTPMLFLMIFISLLFFILVTYVSDRFLIIMEFIFVYQAILGLIYFNYNDASNSITA